MELLRGGVKELDFEIGDRVEVVEGEEFVIPGPPDPSTGAVRQETLRKHPAGRLLAGRKGKAVEIKEHPYGPEYGFVARIEFPFGFRWVNEKFLVKVGEEV